MKKSYFIYAGLLIIFLAWSARKIMNRSEFKAKYYKDLEGEDLKGFPAWLLGGTASYEGGDGNGKFAAPPYYNVFSLQVPKKGWAGKKVLQASTGNYFRAYNSYREATRDFLNLLIGWPSKYGPAVAAARKGDSLAFAKALQAAGYGDPGKTTYASELFGRIESFKG